MDAALPLGIQLVAAPFMEASLFRVAARLEARRESSPPRSRQRA
jgi:Asp-tRNA(Asn)/Glu-tRNA(Gln) amidotransferase A subunit family amidase